MLFYGFTIRLTPSPSAVVQRALNYSTTLQYKLQLFDHLRGLLITIAPLVPYKCTAIPTHIVIKLMPWLSPLVSRLRAKWTNLKSHKPKPQPSTEPPPLEAVYTLPPRDDAGRPPPPGQMLAGRLIYEMPLLRRKKADPDTDAPTAALYRIYEHLMLDQHIEIRNEFEAFWFQNTWLVFDVPDPKDPDPGRYACIASIAKLLVLAFNKRIDLGLPRHAPPIFTRDMLDEWLASERARETTPLWADQVPRLEHTFCIPHWDNDQRDFVPPESFDTYGVSEEFAEKNILILQPHIHFI